MPLSDRYADLELIGEGVSAKVYKALDRGTNSAVAIKFLNPHLRTDPISVERFRREVQITRLLNHPHIVSVYDLVVEGDQVCLIMEFVAGDDLKQYLRLHAPLPVDTVLSIVTQVLRVLSACHAQYVVHRDLKPQNIMVTAGGQVRLLDFGIARMATLSDLTQTGTSLGSPEYMAPELFAASTYDPRTDLYALGVIAFELLAGRLPFQGDSLAVLCQQHLQAPVPDLRAVRHDVPEWLQQAIERLLAKHAYERYQAAEEVLLDLERRMVIARQLPTMPKRECLHCGADTLAEVPVCTMCGYDAADAVRRGTYDVYCTEATDRQTVVDYFAAVFGVTLPRTRPLGTLLIAGIDAAAADHIKRSALSHGLYLSILERSTPRRARRAVSTLLLLAVAAWFGPVALAALLNLPTVLWQALKFWAGPERWTWMSQGGPEVLTVCWIAIFGLAGWAVVALYRREHQSPAFADPTVLAQRVSRINDWLPPLTPFFKMASSEPLKRSIAQMVEKYLLLIKLGRPALRETADQLQELLQHAIAVARVMAEVEPRLDEARLAELGARQNALAERLQCIDDPAQRRLLQRRADATAAEIRAFDDLEQRYSRLMNRLVHLQYVFNTVLGRAVVLRQAAPAEGAEILEQCVRGLTQHLDILREIDTELRRVA